jgi:DNA helicase-2/ATP-dependent DNA helicase PcrA
MKHSVEAFLQGYQAEILPRSGLVFGGHVLYTPEEVQDIFLKQLRPFPLAQRIDELKKYIKKRLLQVAEAMKAAMDKMAQDRLTLLLSSLPDGEERRARARKLLQSRDERMAEIDQRAKQYLKDFPSLFPDITEQRLR